MQGASMGMQDEQDKISSENERKEERKLLEDFQSGNEEAFSALCLRYDPLLQRLVRSAVHRYGEYGAESEDFMQEARLAFYKAAVRFNWKQSEVTFGLYSKICVKNRLISAGRRLISHSISASESSPLDVELVASRHKVAGKVSEELAERVLSLLSVYERQVFSLYCQGLSYEQIAKNLHKSLKSVDNAIYRIHAKMKNMNS
jgi:RNA polymerase sporulation-specific sigma factor